MTKDNHIKKLHTVTLEVAKCTGCSSCVKRCPTEAIRVRDGKAQIIYDKCIACGECVRICPNNAKIPSYDKLDIIHNYKYKIALVAPSFYGQFNNLSNINYVLTALKNIGFDFVLEVGVGAELASQVTKSLMERGELKTPVISTACPAVLELINERFENLKPNLLPLLPPVDISAKLARERAKKQGIEEKDMGVFFISPCPAKVYAAKSQQMVAKSYVDGVLSASEVYLKLLPEMSKLTECKNLSEMGVTGLQWASSGGEAACALQEKYLAADGIENVLSILEGLENGSMQDLEFVELNACIGGCVGGVLNVENPFVAKARLRQLRKKFPAIGNSIKDIGKPLDFYFAEKQLDTHTVTFDENRQVAFEKLMEIQNLYESLPQIDCGMCGAPSCRAFCEDKVMGRITPDAICPIVAQRKKP